MDTFSERYSRVLSAVVREYIMTAEPVGSKALTTDYSLGVSPATVRNIMAELERDGLLAQPHTSAGRVPTDKGFRRYLDSLVELETPGDIEMEFLRRAFGSRHTVESALCEAARALSSLTGCAGLLLVTKTDYFVISHIKLVPVDPSGVMVVLVSKLGTVETRLVRLGEDAARLDFERIGNYLNTIAGGLTLRGLRERIVGEMRKEKNLYDELLSKALSLGAAFFDGAPGAGDGLYLEGKTNILDQPEFRDNVGRMKSLFSAFEEKSHLVKLLDKTLGEGGIHIQLGSEWPAKEFDGLSFVTAPCMKDDSALGALGVIGPVRMNYSRIIPLVGYTARLLGKLV